jgi:hypothetical protein
MVPLVKRKLSVFVLPCLGARSLDALTDGDRFAVGEYPLKESDVAYGCR